MAGRCDGLEEPGIDAALGTAAPESFTFSLWGENSPSTDADDIRLCTRTFTADMAFELSYLGSSRWNRLCDIPASWSGDHYEVRVTNAGEPAARADGSNQFGIVARYQNSGGGAGLCRPTGSGSWAPVPFEASWPGGSPASVTQLNVTNSRFNGKVVTLRADLTGYDPPPENEQWKVRYTFNDPARPTVTDRTTWDVAVVDH